MNTKETTRKNIWFTADTHFGHANILRPDYCDRPFADIAEHDEALIANWNERVQPGDDVYHLGDFVFRGNPDAVFARLRGNKRLLLGNHDKEKRLKRLPWAWIKHVYELKIDSETRLFLSHYSGRRWPHSHHGAIHLFGHSHGELEDYRRSTDVGVDAWDYAPVHLDTILEYMKDKEPTPHHVRGRVLSFDP